MIAIGSAGGAPGCRPLVRIAGGTSFGYGNDAVIPVRYRMALTWFAGTVVEAVVADLLVGGCVREPAG
jgi:hypothetical protein